MNRKNAFACFMILLCSFTCPIFRCSAEPVPGSRVNIQKPAGFEKAANFAGFQKPLDRASIMVTEIPGPFAQVKSGFSQPDQMAKRGMTLISSADHPVGDKAGLFLEITQQAAGSEFLKWVLVFGDSSSTTIVTAAFPADLKSQLSEPLKASVLSTKIDGSLPEPMKQQDLNFSVTAVPGLKLAGRVQNALLFNPQGSLPKEKQKKPVTMFLAAQALSDLKIDDPPQYTRRRLRQTVGLSNFEIASQKEISVSGLPGQEVLAIADEGEEKVFVYHLMLYGKGSYFILQGFCPLKERESQEPVFTKIARTFKNK